nr:hypothetical protein [Tanacetum cinerariifolium]
RRVQRLTTRSQNYPYKSPSHRSTGHRPNGAPMRPPLRSSGLTHRSAGHRPNGAPMKPPLRSSGPRPHGDSMRSSFRPAENLPMVVQEITLLIWGGREKL